MKSFTGSSPEFTCSRHWEGVDFCRKNRNRKTTTQGQSKILWIVKVMCDYNKRVSERNPQGEKHIPFVFV